MMTKGIYVMVVTALALPAVAAEVKSTERTRVGQPETADSRVARGTGDVADLDGTHSPANAGDPVLEVEMVKMFYDPGEAPILTARVKRADGRGVDAEVFALTDGKHQHKAPPLSHGEYVVTLDDAPGEHDVVIAADAVIDGKSVHRSTSYSYVVTTGNIRVLRLGDARQDDTTLHVPVEVHCTERGFYLLQGTLVSRGIVVASLQSTALIDVGDDSVELLYNLGDLVEAGPYTLKSVMVTQYGPAGKRIAAAPGQVGQPIAIAGAKNAKPLAPPTLSPSEQAVHNAIYGPE